MLMITWRYDKFLQNSPKNNLQRNHELSASDQERRLK